MIDFNERLNKYQAHLGLDYEPSLIEQGSSEWFRLRLGTISASRAKDMMAKKGTAARDGYMAQLIGEVITGELPPEINAKSLAWGKDNEEMARNVFKLKNKAETVEQFPFIFKDTDDKSMFMRCGCSPDGIPVISGKQVGLELKCPITTRTWVEFATDGKIKPEYVKQCEFSMWVTGLDCWYFANFDPRIKTCSKIHQVIIERDDKAMEEIENKVGEFIQDMDAKLAQLGVEFGQQWSNI